jgi:hypothetical protein
MYIHVFTFYFCGHDRFTFLLLTNAFDHKTPSDDVKYPRLHRFGTHCETTSLTLPR